MYSVAIKMINDKDAVCDIIQDIFVYYHKTSQNGNTINMPKSWLIRATINKCIDYSKYKKRHIQIDRLKPIPFADDTIEKNQNTEMVKHALSELKPREKTLAILYGEGMSYKEISEISGIKFSSVGKMLSRTIKKLDKILKKLGYEMY